MAKRNNPNELPPEFQAGPIPSDKNGPLSVDSLLLEKGLPGNPPMEALVLGMILAGGGNDLYERTSAVLSSCDFLLHKHKLIWDRMGELYADGLDIDRITLAQALMSRQQLEAVDGLTYLSTLDKDVPVVANPETYWKQIRELSSRRTLIVLAEQMMEQSLRGDLLSSEIRANVTSKLDLVQDDTGDPGRSAERIVSEFPGGIEAFMDPNKQPLGMKTGFFKLDEMTGGLHAGEFVIIAARPSHGKTAFMLNLAHHLSVDQDLPGGIFSLETGGAMLIRRMMCAAAEVDSQKFRVGYTTKDERYRLQLALSKLATAPLTIYDRFETDIHKVVATIRKMVKKLGWKWVAIDYIQLMGGDKRAENQNLRIAGISRGLKLAAHDLGISVIALSQLSRRNEQRPGGSFVPQPSDLRDSGTLEQDVDTLMFVHREEIYRKDREDLKGLASLIVAKQRNGPTGVIPLVFRHSLTKFENKAAEEDSQGSMGFE